MELELFRHDLLQSGTCARGTLAVLPQTEERKTQKVAVGDLQGVVQCAGLRKGELASVFKTLPAPTAKITSLTLGKGAQQGDRIFVAAGNTIKGITKKGKEFFKFNSLITETIKKVDVHDKFIWSSAEFVHHQFVEGRDKAFYLAPDRIHDAELVPLGPNGEQYAALGCQDRQVRLLAGDRLLYEVPTPSVPSTLRHVPEPRDTHQLRPGPQSLLVGTEAGTVVQLLLDSDGARQGFVIRNPTKLGAVNAIHAGLSLSGSGTPDVVVGREDGSLEVHALDGVGGAQQVFSVNVNESICTVDGGCVTNPTVPELVLHTFSGKVAAYAPPGGGLLLLEGDKRLRGTVTDADKRRAAYQAQLSGLRAELEGLKEQLEKEKKGFEERLGDASILAAAAPFTLRDRCKLDPEEGCYTLGLESSVPIFTVALSATLGLSLMDVPSNVAILSRCKPDPPNGAATLATYRCQDSTCRLGIKFAVREGAAGSLQAFVIPSVAPKVAVVVSHKIKPLCLHERITEPDTSRPANELVIRGGFTLSDAHAWLLGLLPDVPPLAAASSDLALCFRHTLVGSQLLVKCTPGHAAFSSDLLTTLSIIHDHVMREATVVGQRLAVDFSPSVAALRHSMAAVWPRLAAQRSLKARVDLLAGLLELKMQDLECGRYLTPTQRQTLEGGDQLKAAYKVQGPHLEHLIGLMKDLFQDHWKLAHGQGAPRARLPALERLLADPHSTLDDALMFITSAPVAAS